MNREALERWADDKFLLGNHLGQMMHAHLDLEESIAMGSLSQDELSHCSIVCEMLGDVSERDKDRRLLLRDPAQFKCSSLAAAAVETWPDAVAKHLLYETAEAQRVELLGAGTVIEREEALHRRHWLAWSAVLAAQPLTHAALEESIARLWPLTDDLFDMALDISPERWRADLEAYLAPLGIAPPHVVPSASRSHRPPGVQADLFDTLEKSQSVYRSSPSAVWG